MMAANHTAYSAITDALAVSFLWDYIKKNSGVTKGQAVDLAKTGLLSVSNVLEQAISDTSGLKRSNADGEDFVDGSDAKYMRARNIKHSSSNSKYQYERTWCALSAKSLRNKKGALRIFITYLDERLGKNDFRLFLIPYADWQKKMGSGQTAVSFSFSSKDGCLTKTTKEKWGEYEVVSFNKFSRKVK